jgi:multiple sugar transport system substrate-binding protein
MGLAAAGTVVAACGPAPAGPVAPVAEATPTREVAIVLPTATLPAAPTEVPQWTGATELRQQVHWSGETFNLFKALCDEWNLGPGRDKNIYIHTERHGATGDEPEWAAFYIADYLAGTSPDIYHLSGGLLPDLQAQGVLAPPPPEVQAYIQENYAPGAVAYATVEGETYGYPTELQAQVNWINTRHLKEAGLDTDPARQPTNWDEMRVQAQALTARDAAGKKTRGGYIWQDGYAESQFISRVVMHQAEGEPFIDLDNLKSNANSEVGAAIMKLWYDICVTDDSSTAGLVGWGDAYQNDLGSVIQIDAWYGFFGIVLEAGEDVFNDTIVTLMPTQTGENPKSEARIYLFAVSSPSEQKEEAWEFLRWLNEKPDIRMMNFMVNSFGFLPGHKDMDMPEFFTPQMVEVFQKALDVSIPMPFARGLFEMYEAVGNLQDAVAFGEKGWEEASTELADSIDTILKEKYG